MTVDKELNQKITKKVKRILSACKKDVASAEDFYLSYGKSIESILNDSVFLNRLIDMVSNHYVLNLFNEEWSLETDVYNSIESLVHPNTINGDFDCYIDNIVWDSKKLPSKTVIRVSDFSGTQEDVVDFIFEYLYQKYNSKCLTFQFKIQFQTEVI